jgi:hypothetical protein
VLSDWLESPDFPHGLYTFRAPKPPLRVGNSDSDPGQAQPPTQP